MRNKGAPCAMGFNGTFVEVGVVLMHVARPGGGSPKCVAKVFVGMSNCTFGGF